MSDTHFLRFVQEEANRMVDLIRLATSMNVSESALRSLGSHIGNYQMVIAGTLLEMLKNVYYGSSNGPCFAYDSCSEECQCRRNGISDVEKADKND